MDLTQRAELLLNRVPEVAQSLVGDVWERLPGYDDARMDLDDLVGVVTPNLRALLVAVAGNRGLRPDEVTPAAQLGERRAVQGVPIEGVVASWHSAERRLLDQLVAAGPPMPPDEYTRLARLLAGAVDVMVAVSTEAYRRTRSEAAAHLDQIATDLVSRLAGGEPLDPAHVEERARLIGVAAQVPHRAVAVGGPGDDPLQVARAQREIVDVLRPRLRSRILVGSKDATVLLVLPDLPGLGDMLSRAARRPGVAAGTVIGLGEPRDRLGEAAASCREAVAALEAGRRAGLDRVVVPFDQVIADVMLIDNPLDARRLAARALEPLAGHGQLVDTVRAYLATGLSVRRTAERLAVHENTVSYRLRRVSSLLGLAGPDQLIRADLLLALRAVDLGLY
ncbi:PucR family transcriptional regulator [Jiangella muralis]|uniref:PucR family transcriptional regulator n=1 Tax=Jiangella muralis TaxID=702383 RepID=UPI00069F3898|nr:helix-turn-helix domain-containing protein [Jiangella muralis]